MLLRGREYTQNFFKTQPLSSTFTWIVTQWGFSRGIHAVLYDRDGKSAVRAWWMFQYFGHAKVSVLQGGLQRWKLQKRPMAMKEIKRLQPAP